MHRKTLWDLFDYYWPFGLLFVVMIVIIFFGLGAVLSGPADVYLPDIPIPEWDDDYDRSDVTAPPLPDPERRIRYLHNGPRPWPRHLRRPFTRVAAPRRWPT